MVAARTILGDLYVTEAMLDVILARGRWPDRLDLDAPLSTWREFRAAFAAGVTVWEWALTDSFYASFARTALMIELGAPLGPGERAVVEELAASLPAVQQIAAEHATDNERERRRATDALSGTGREDQPPDQGRHLRRPRGS